MKHPERAEDYLEHIAEAVERATSYLQELDSVAASELDHKTQAAVIRKIEIIGEAANRIQREAPDFVSAHLELPWGKMRGIRNRMIHDYFNVNVEIVWGTFKEDLPQLKSRLMDCWMTTDATGKANGMSAPFSGNSHNITITER